MPKGALPSIQNFPSRSISRFFAAHCASEEWIIRKWPVFAMLVALDEPLGIAAVFVDEPERKGAAALGADMTVGEADQVIAAVNAEGVFSLAHRRFDGSAGGGRRQANAEYQELTAA